MIAIVKYNAGNIGSVMNAMHRLNCEAIITDDPEQLAAADKVIFPGVGEANSTMNHLKKLGLDKVIPNLTQPVLGVCLGMQLMCSHSEENDTDCLDIIPQKVIRFSPTSKEVKAPHIGWNKISSKMTRGFQKKFQKSMFISFTVILWK